MDFAERIHLYDNSRKANIPVHYANDECFMKEAN